MAEAAGSALERELQLALLGRHRPELRYHPDERCAATSVEALLDPGSGIRRTRLRARDESWVASTDDPDTGRRFALELLRPAGAPYRDAEPQPLVSARDHLDFDFDRELRIGREDVAYGRVVDLPDGGHWLQYWLFYADNPHVPLVGVHEGDWEMVQVLVGAVASEAEVENTRMLARTYSQHGHPESRAGQPDDSPTPIVYVAEGSHASYYREGDGPFTDDTSDEGRSVQPDVRLLGEQGWIDWPGRWGATEWHFLSFGNQSPPGPKIDRLAWRSPQEFHESGLAERRRVGPAREQQAWSSLLTDLELSIRGLGAEWRPEVTRRPGDRVPVRLLATALAEGAEAGDLERAVAEVCEQFGGERPEIAGFGDAANGPDRAVIIGFEVGRAPGLGGAQASFEAARLLDQRLGGWEVDADIASVGFSPAFLDRPGHRAGEDDPAWALAQLRCPEAWELAPAPGGRARGEGVLVGHPDTGYLLHPELERGAIAEHLGYDVVDGDRDATDASFDLPPFALRGHGTATASVIVSRSAGILSGSAPLAHAVPFRCTTSVVLLRASGLIGAIRRAREARCRVISISLGGVFLNAGLRLEIQDAVREGIIVIAAAGQPFPFVVEPASYPECVAVGGTDAERRFWDASARGPAVDVSGPAVNVPRASARTNDVMPGSGTSYATALTAGVGALWVAHHGDRLAAELGDPERIAPAFAEILRRTAVPGEDWDPGSFGAGIVDARAALAYPLAEVAAEADAPPGSIPARERRVVETLARLTSRSPEATASWLERALGDGRADVHSQIEIIRQVAEDFELREQVAVAIEADAAAPPPVPEPIRDRASPSLRRALAAGGG